MADHQPPAASRRSTGREDDHDEGPEERARRILGARIRARRRELGLTIEALAHRAGLDRSYVSEVERGRYAIGLHNLGYFAFALGADPADLVQGLALDPFPDD